MVDLHGAETIAAVIVEPVAGSTGVLVPPEHLGGHVGDRRAHITGRAASLGFRLATAFFGSAGIERNLTRSDAAERAVVAAWVAEHKARRDLLHSGVVVRGDPPDGEPHPESGFSRS